MADLEPIAIARCPTHGLHGARETCFQCGGPVEQAGVIPVERVRPLYEALLYLADEENWLGDPHAYGAPLHGHETPYELAVRVLEE